MIDIRRYRDSNLFCYCSRKLESSSWERMVSVHLRWCWKHAYKLLYNVVSSLNPIMFCVKTIQFKNGLEIIVIFCDSIISQCNCIHISSCIVTKQARHGVTLVWKTVSNLWKKWSEKRTLNQGTDVDSF